MGIIKYFEKKISSFEDSMKKALGFDPTDYASKYTTNYDYSLHIPPPCTYYSTVNAGQCCTTKQYNENKSECKLCTPEAEKANKCVYNMDKPETTKEWNDTNVHDWFANVIKNGDSIDTYLDIIGEGNHALPLGSRFYAKNGHLARFYLKKALVKSMITPKNSQSVLFKYQQFRWRLP